MNMNAMLIRSSILMVVALVLAFSAVHQMPSAHAQSVAARAPVQAGAANAPVLLPTIKVRPSAADLAEAQQSDAGLIEAANIDVIYETLTPNMPSLRMDMPYYSFGKALRRGVKE